MRRRGDQTECALCGAPLEGITEKSTVLKVLIGSSGEYNVRAIIVNGEEIHRCRSLAGAHSDASRDLAAASRRMANHDRDVADEGGADEDARRETALGHDADAAQHEVDAQTIDRRDQGA